MFFLFCKESPSGLSADEQQQAQTRLQNDDEHLPTRRANGTDALQKRGFPLVFVKSLLLRAFVFS